MVELEEPQLAQVVGALVTDPSGTAVPDVVVQERSQDWGTVLRSTKTDERGRFRFPTTRDKAVY